MDSLAYIAGILDGEGSVTVKVKAYKSHVLHTLKVIITNTSSELIDYISIRIPGITSSYQPKNRRHKVVYTLCWHGSYAADVLELLLPYLVVKRDVALVGLEMWDECFASRERKSALTEAEIILRKSYKDRISILNIRGN